MFTLLTLEFLINKVKYAANHQNSLNHYNFLCRAFSYGGA